MFTPDLPPRSQPQPGHLYDVAVVGAGLAGCELAWRLARVGHDVLLVTQALDHLGALYRPDLKGVAFLPGSLFAQVAAEMGAQRDGWLFHRRLKGALEGTSGIHLLQSCVTGLEEGEGDGGDGDGGEGGTVTLSTWEGPPLRARRVALAVGAFLKARLLVGETMEDAGRLSEVAYDFLADDLQSQGLWLMPTEASAAPVEGAPGYEVRFLTLGAGEQDGFRLRRLRGVYAAGQMTGGQHTYASVLKDAARLADLLDTDLLQEAMV